MCITPSLAAKEARKALYVKQQRIFAANNAARQAENGRRSRYRANNHSIRSIGRLASNILPRPLGLTIELASEILIIIAKINDWRQANNYRQQVNSLIFELNQIKANRRKIAETMAAVNGYPVVPKAQSKALPASKKANHPTQQPAYDHVVKEISVSGSEMARQPNTATIKSITGTPSQIAIQYREYARQINDSDPAKARILTAICNSELCNAPNNREISIQHPSADLIEIRNALKQQGITGGRKR